MVLFFKTFHLVIGEKHTVPTVYGMSMVHFSFITAFYGPTVCWLKTSNVPSVTGENGKEKERNTELRLAFESLKIGLQKQLLLKIKDWLCQFSFSVQSS